MTLDPSLPALINRPPNTNARKTFTPILNDRKKNYYHRHCATVSFQENAYLRWVNVLSLLDFMKPRFIKIFNWFNGLVASSAPFSFELLVSWWIFRKSSNFMINDGSLSHCMHSPFSMLRTIKLILSFPYSPHANSITANRQINCERITNKLN